MLAKICKIGIGSIVAAMGRTTASLDYFTQNEIYRIGLVNRSLQMSQLVWDHLKHKFGNFDSVVNFSSGGIIIFLLFPTHY